MHACQTTVESCLSHLAGLKGRCEMTACYLVDGDMQSGLQHATCCWHAAKGSNVCRNINHFGRKVQCTIEALPPNPRTGRVHFKMTCVKITCGANPAAKGHQQSMTRLANLKAAIAQVAECALLATLLLCIACPSAQELSRNLSTVAHNLFDVLPHVLLTHQGAVKGSGYQGSASACPHSCAVHAMMPTLCSPCLQYVRLSGTPACCSVVCVLRFMMQFDDCSLITCVSECIGGQQSK